MGKRKKKEDVIDFEAQQNSLKMIDALLSGKGTITDEVIEEVRDENYSNEDFVNDIFGLMEEDRQYKNAGGRDEPIEPEVEMEPVFDASSYYDKTNGRTAEVSPRVNPNKKANEASEPEVSLNHITVEHKFSMEGAYNALTFSDGIRSFSVDLMTLDHDTKDIEEVYGGNTTIISRMVLNSIMANFYPSAILTKNKLDSYMRHVTTIDDSNLWFYEFSENDINLVAGYVFDQDSLDVFDRICETMKESGYLLSFLSAIFEMSSMMNGFCFRGLSTSFIHQIMLTYYMNEQTKVFIQQILNNRHITKSSDDHFNESSNDILTILPCDFMNDEIVDILCNLDEDEEDYDDDEDDDEDEDEDDESDDSSFDFVGNPHDEDDNSDEVCEKDVLSEQVISEQPSEEMRANTTDTHQEIFEDRDFGANQESVTKNDQNGQTEETDKVDEDDSYEDLLDDVGEESNDRQTEEPVEDVEEESVGGYSTDPEQAELDYYASKGQKPPRQTPPQKKPKPSEQDDDASNWIIPVR